MELSISDCDLDSDLIESCFIEAEKALKCGEVPVGCVFVRGQKEVIAKAHNRTNELKCALKHAEMDCISQVVSQFPDCHEEVFKQTVVLITLEPCIMCCRMLRMLQVKAVFFGARNDRFGGAGSVYNVDTDNKIKCKPLKCIAGALNAQRAIELLQKFYEQANENVPKVAVRDKIHEPLK